MAVITDRRYSQTLYLPEQQEELKALYQKAVEVGRNPDSTPQERVEALAAAQRREVSLYKEARARYRDSFAGDYARIMEALRHDIAATPKAEFVAYTKRSKEEADKVKAAFMAQQEGKPAQEVPEEYKEIFGGIDQTRQRFARRNYTGYFHFLESNTTIYKEALKAAGLPLEEYAAALDAAAATAYPQSPRIIYFQTRPRPRPEWERVTPEEYAQRISGQEVQEAEPQPLPSITPEELEAVAELPMLQSIVPIQHTMPNNTLINDLAGARGKQPINAGAYDLPVLPATKRRGETTVYVMANYEPEKGIVSNISEYERDVSDAFMSIYEQAKRDGKPAAFTTDSLYRAMPGRGERASPQQKGAITKTIEKYIRLYMDVDATEELRKRRVIGERDTYHVKDYYLPAQEHVYKTKGGQTVRAWLITREPLILTYAKMTKQLLTVPAKYLAIEKVKQGNPSGELLTMNAQRQAMTSYMLRRIAVMKHDLEQAKEAMRSYERRRKKDSSLEPLPLSAFRGQSDTILFDSLFKATGAENSSRELMRRNRDFCFAVLDFWKASGWIKGYSQQIKGRNITGVIIEH